MPIESWDVKQLWARVAAVREQAPLVHNITNFVVMNNTANALLALGASPAMVHSLDEVEDFVAISQALVVNIGTLDSQQIAACKLAALRASAVGTPWILDPVGAGATPYRRAAASALARLRPTVIRGNGSEILSLAQQTGQGRGVDSAHGSNMALGAAQLLAAETGAVVAVTGAVDYVTDGAQVVAIENGHLLMTRVTGLGCSATAVIGAFLAVEADALTATVAALATFGVAGEIAAETARGPGSLQMGLLDTLYRLDEATLDSRARVKVFEPVEEARRSG
jgi:hydroxyethylthiazole kinase